MQNDNPSGWPELERLQRKQNLQSFGLLFVLVGIASCICIFLL